MAAPIFSIVGIWLECAESCAAECAEACAVAGTRLVLKILLPKYIVIDAAQIWNIDTIICSTSMYLTCNISYNLYCILSCLSLKPGVTLIPKLYV